MEKSYEEEIVQIEPYSAYTIELFIYPPIVVAKFAEIIKRACAPRFILTYLTIYTESELEYYAIMIGASPFPGTTVIRPQLWEKYIADTFIIMDETDYIGVMMIIGGIA